MPTLILVRHGRSTANTSGCSPAGPRRRPRRTRRRPGRGAARPARGVPLAAAVSSPLQRCLETLAPLLDARPELRLETDERITECDYGDWSGRKLAELTDEPLMETVQQHPPRPPSPAASRCGDAGPRGERGAGLERPRRGDRRRRGDLSDVLAR
ncbi:histidine phosphatase family protein [Streptomyces albulus]|nr:histidine phosphatase family protein [Streptomyces noursei]